MTSELRRRDVLRASGTVALAGAAGCLDDAIGEPLEEGNDSDGEGDDGDDPTTADDNDTETVEETDDPVDEGGTNGTDGNGFGESNDSGEGNDAKTPADADDGDPGGANESTGVNDSDVTDEAEDPNENEDSVGDGGDESKGGSDENDKSDQGNETEDGEGDEDSGNDGIDAEGTETEANDSGGDKATDSPDDNETGEGNSEDNDGGEGGDDGETQSDDPPEGFVTYTNDELGYSIIHPEGWEIEESGEEVYVGDPESRRELGVLTLNAAAFDSSEALAAEFLANLEADYEAVEVREEGDRSLASGQDARLLDVVYGDPESERGRRRSRLLFVTDSETDAGYVAEVAAPAEAFDDALGERAERMLESFQIESGESVERIGGPRALRLLARLGIGS